MKQLVQIDERHYKLQDVFYGNQYVSRRRRRRTRSSLKAFCALLVFLFVFFYIGVSFIVSFQQTIPVISPLATTRPVYAQAIKPAQIRSKTRKITPTAAPIALAVQTRGKSQSTLIEQDIKEVFGQYSDEAFALLQSPQCHENMALDPKAQNTNNDQWHSTDWGVFQINDHWQNIGNPAFLTDYDINIRIAWRIFVNNGYRFGLPPSGGWTCGRVLGI